MTQRYLGVIRRWWWLLTIGTLVAGGTSYLVSRSIPPTYESTVKLLVSREEAAERLARTYADLIMTRPILEQAVQTLGLPEAMQPGLLSGVRVWAPSDTPFVQISAEYTDPRVARDLATAVAMTFIERIDADQKARSQALREGLESQLAQIAQELDSGQAALIALESQPVPPAGQGGEARQAQFGETARLRREVLEAQQRYTNLLRAYEDVRLADARAQHLITIVEPANLPAAPKGPKVSLSTALATAVGLLLGLGIVLVVDFFDDRVSNPNRLSELAALPTLAVVGELGSSQRPPASEPYQRLRTNFQFSVHEQPLRTVLVTSAEAGEGKTTTAANLAVALAQAGFDTVLVDADLRQPALHELFGVRNERGLTSLALRVPTAQALVECLQASAVPNLRVLAAGPPTPNPSALLGSKQMAVCLEELAKMAEYVVIDSPPVLALPDPLALAPQVDGVILVINARRAQRGAVLRVQEALESVGARVLGAVLNRASKETPRYAPNHSGRPPLAPAGHPPALLRPTAEATGPTVPA
ncbi:MAG: polysaccharide biosynthesis tyrosine autokinase [Chloroflexi bacterium]|nr:polysaccharide biosynthesis tyrosine autokinase [Chloroflexota bacterium]